MSWPRYPVSLARCAMIALGAIGCGPQPEPCHSADDCPEGHLCRLAQCVRLREASSEASGPQADASSWPKPAPLRPGQAPSSQETDMSDTTDLGARAPDAAPAEQGRPCQGRPPAPGELVLHEVLMSVPAGLEGDANGDGTRDAYEDEFVELLNVTASWLDLHGVQVVVGERARYTFGQDCLAPGHGAVVFGGPKGAAARTHPLGALMRVAPARLSLSNTSGAVALRDKQLRWLALFEYQDPRPVSYTLWPEHTGQIMVEHSSVSGALFSPGTCADGQPLQSGCLPREPHAWDMSAVDMSAADMSASDEEASDR